MNLRLAESQFPNQVQYVLKMNCVRESYPMEKRTIFKLITTLALLASIGGCTIKSKEQTKQAPIATPSTTKEDKKTIKQKQLTYLKEHEQEIVDFVKAQNSKVESVQVDWNSMQIEESGNGTPQGGGYNLSISGQINQLENTKFSVDFYLEDQNSIPTIKKMGMLNDIYIEENGGWKIFS